jgi:hypothetical protein
MARQASRVGQTCEGSAAQTGILDWASTPVQALVQVIPQTVGDDRRVLQSAHAAIAERVRPVYALDDAQSASRTVMKGRGSCSQRLAVLEAVARAFGVRTRVRGLVIDGRFWYPRFPLLRFAIPDAVILAWPEFLLDGEWVSVSQLFGAFSPDLNAKGFTNADGETLFDAVARTVVDWDGVTSTPDACSACDLSAQVLRDLGYFNSRDELFAQQGQTLCGPARFIGEPVLGRWSAGAIARG